MLALPKAKGVLWLGRAWVFWLQIFPKGVTVRVTPPGIAPMPNTPESELLSGAVTLTPDSPQSIGVTNPPKAKGRGAVLPNTELEAPLRWASVTGPKQVALAWLDAEVLPKSGGSLAGV